MGMADAETLAQRYPHLLTQDPYGGQTLTQRYAPQWGQYLPPTVQEFLREAPIAALGYAGMKPPALPKQRYFVDPSRRYQLSGNYAQNPGEFAYDIMNRGGTTIGGLAGDVRGHQATIDMIGGARGLSSAPNTMGPSAMRALREEFRRDFPDVVEFRGGRISGSRAGEYARQNLKRYEIDDLPLQSVIMP